MLKQTLTNKDFSMMDLQDVFGRINSEGNVDILDINEGCRVNRLDVDGIYPVNSNFSTRYDHPEGIVISLADAQKLGIEIE